MKFIFVKVLFRVTDRGIVSEVLGGKVYTHLGSAASFGALCSVNNCSIWPFFCLAVLFLWSYLKVCSSLFLSCSLGVVLCYVFILSMESSCLRVPALILLCQFDSSKGLCSGKDNQSVKKTDFFLTWILVFWATVPQRSVSAQVQRWWAVAGKQNFARGSPIAKDNV